MESIFDKLEDLKMTYTKEYAESQLNTVIGILLALEDQTDYEIEKITQAINLLQEVSIENWKLANKI
jgi:hypothetical protein